MKISGVVPENIAVYAGEIMPLLERVIDTQKLRRYYSPEDILAQCATEKMQCWVAGEGQIDAVIITHIAVHPSGYRSLDVPLICGDGMRQWLKPLWKLLKAFAKANGCQEINGHGREGWARVVNRLGKTDFEDEYMMRFTL